MAPFYLDTARKTARISCHNCAFADTAFCIRRRISERDNERKSMCSAGLRCHRRLTTTSRPECFTSTCTSLLVILSRSSRLMYTDRGHTKQTSAALSC